MNNKSLLILLSNNNYKKKFKMNLKNSYIYNLNIKRININKLKIKKVSPPVKLPSEIDLRLKFQKVYDQGALGSCTANALCGLIGYNIPSLYGSRLFVYYNERVLENSIPYDAGATLEDGIIALQKYGVCQESEWVYDITKFNIKPPDECYISALEHTISEAENIHNDMTDMKNSLVNGYPFVVGIAIYKSFESIIVSKNGMVPMPHSQDTLLGGHAVICVGYDDNKQVWIMRNSWGSNWGDKGYFYLPYLYLLDSSLASDLWTISKIN